MNTETATKSTDDAQIQSDGIEMCMATGETWPPSAVCTCRQCAAARKRLSARGYYRATR